MIFKMKIPIIQKIKEICTEIIPPISRPLIKKLFWRDVNSLSQGVQISLSKQETELSDQEMKSFSPLLDL